MTGAQFSCCSIFNPKRPAHVALSFRRFDLFKIADAFAQCLLFPLIHRIHGNDATAPHKAARQSPAFATRRVSGRPLQPLCDPHRPHSIFL